jgi:hypothetical protein
VLTAHITYGRSGYSLEIEKTPLWSFVADEVIGTVVMEWICAGTGHHLCAPRDWMYEVGIGTDPDPEPSTRLPHRWSLGQAAFWISQHAIEPFWRRRTTVFTTPLTRDQVMEHFPDRVPDWFTDSDDTDSAGR